MRYLLLLLAFFFTGCGCGGQNPRTVYRVGIDPNWGPLDFGNQQPYVNGYTEELLLQMARYHGVAFKKSTGDNAKLIAGLKKGRYDAVLTSMPPYEFNKAKFDFSQNFLNTGLVLVMNEEAKYSDLSDLSDELVGIVTNSPAALIVEKNPKVIIRTYSSIPETLDAIVAGEIEAAVLPRLPVFAYVRDLYNEKLKIAPEPLTKEGLHAIAKKGSGSFIRMFNKSIERMKKKHSLESLEKKWQLQ